MPHKRVSQTITLWYSRLSFPHLWEPHQIVVQGKPIGDPRYSTLIVLTDEMKAKVKEMEDWIIRQAWPEWGGIAPPQGVNLTRAMKPGEVVRPKDSNLKGTWVLSANAKPDSPPVVVRDHQGTNVALNADERHLVYSGCEAHVAVGLYSTQLQAAAPQINCGLNLIKLTGRQLPRFDNRQTADEAFAGEADAPAPPPIPEGAPVPVSPPAQGSGASLPEGDDVMNW